MDVSDLIEELHISTANTEIEIDAVFEGLKEKIRLPSTLKNEQKLVLSCILQKRNCFAILPTGFGKSLTYMLAAPFHDKVCKTVLYILYSYMQQQAITKK